MNQEKIEKINETLKKIEFLQKELEACPNDEMALDIQEKLMHILSGVFEDEGFIETLASLKNIK
jgi:hypothetical protein